MKVKINQTFTMVLPGENRTEKDEIRFRAGEERDVADDVAAIIIKNGFGAEVKAAPAIVATTTEEPTAAKVKTKGSAA